MSSDAAAGRQPLGGDPQDGSDRAPRSRRLRRLMVVAIGLATVIALSWLGWLWRHPTAFYEVGGWGMGNTRSPVNVPIYLGMSYEHDDARGTVAILSARANVVGDSAGAQIDLFVCTVDKSAGVGAIGSVRGSDIDQECSSLVPAEGATIELNADPRQQLVMAVSLAHPGVVKVHGLDLTYSHGWQRGTQRIGGDVVLRNRSDG